MTQPLYAFPTQDEIMVRLLRPLRRAGAARLCWRTACEPGDGMTYITSFVLEDPAGEPLPPTLFRSGFMVMYAISDAVDRDGGCFELDLGAGVYRGIASMPAIARAAMPPDAAGDTAGAALEDDLAG